MEKFWLLIECLYKGKELKNAATWKSAGALTGIFAAMLKLLETMLPDLHIGSVDHSQIINGLTSIALVFGAYVHIGSSSKVGLK